VAWFSLFPPEADNATSFAKINADINVAVLALVAINVKAYVCLDIVAVVTVYAKVFLCLFPALIKVTGVVPACATVYFPALDVQLTALVNICVTLFVGFLVVFAPRKSSTA